MLRGKSFNNLSKGKKCYTFFAFVLFVKIFLINSLFSMLFSGVVYGKEMASVGVVNVTFLMENAPQAEVASTKLKNKFLPQEKKLSEDLDEINVLSSALEKIPASESANLKQQKERELRSRKRVRSRLLQDFREELRFARDAALDSVQKEVFNAIDEVRKLENIDIVLQDYVSAAKRVDITPLVLSYLKKKLEKSQNTVIPSQADNTK